MPNLVIDIGNTRTKIAVFDNREMVHHEIASVLSEDKIQELLADFNISHSILCAVTAVDDRITRLLDERTGFILFSHRYPASVNLRYGSPETLGLDRLAGVIGAMKINQGGNSLVIDCGTCITMDAVTKVGEYFGGSISPGLNMRFKALHEFTGKLPLVAGDPVLTDWRGTDTRSSILCGVQEGAYYEVSGFIARYADAYPELQVILCGGDANFFDTRLKNSIFADIVKTEPALILTGLNEVIHHYND